MKKIIVPLILLLGGVGAGVGAGLFLVSEPEELVAENPCGDAGVIEASAEPIEATPEPAALGDREFARMNNQFVVPIVIQDRVTAMMVISLSIEVETGGKEAVFSYEPRLRDAFLQVMFDHANMGGFNGAFTASSNMRVLREALRDAAFETMQGHITDVLIVDMVRQDVIN